MTSYIQYFSVFTSVFVFVLQSTFGNGAGAAEDVKLYFEQAVLIWGASRLQHLYDFFVCESMVTHFNQVQGAISCATAQPPVAASAGL